MHSLFCRLKKIQIYFIKVYFDILNVMGLYNSEYLAHTIFKIGKWIHRASNWLTIQYRGESWLSITISFIMFCVIHLSLRKELVAHFVSFHVWVCVHTQKRPIVINCFCFQKTTAVEEEEIQKNHCPCYRLVFGIL